MNQASNAFATPLKLPYPLFWAVLVASAWLALWYLPWQAEFHSIVWLQLGGALILFIAFAGQAMDRQITGQAYVMGSQNLNDLIPGITLKTNLVTYRISDPANMLYFTQAERERRIADTAAIFSKSTPVEDKLFLLEKYNVRFLLLQRGDLLLFEDLTARHPDRAKAIEVGGAILLEITN